MINAELRNEYCSSPANSDYQILRHPSGNPDKTIEVALFHEHRFAFYYWLRWNVNNSVEFSPDLITFDWHQDLAYPCEHEQNELKQLDTTKLSEVSFYSWARLNPLNDNHILSAAYLNQINDIWVVCKQSHFSNWDNEEFIDLDGKVHTIRKFSNHKNLFERLKETKITNIYFDLDLDYFTIENSSANDKHRFTYVTNKEIERIFNIENELMKWLFERMDGFTIALEPKHTGGIMKSLKYLSLINKLLFNGDILHWDCKWKHL